MTRATADRRLDLVPAPRIRRAEPDLSAAAAALARWYVEHRAGRRAATQLHTVLTPTLRRRLAGRVVRRTGTCVAGSSRTVVVQHPSASACEAVVLVDDGRRTVAVCVRFERGDHGWQVAELTSPHDGEAPVRTEVDPWSAGDAFDEVCGSDAA